MKLAHFILLVLGLLILLGTTIFVAICWDHIPASVPTHFNNSGEPDSYGVKSMIFFPLAAGFILYVASSATLFFPQLWNIPRGWSLGPIRWMIVVLNLIIALMFAYLTVCTARGTGLAPWFSVTLAGSIFVTLGVGMFFSYKRK